MADVIVTNDPEGGRYEAAVDGRTAGLLEHRREGDVVVMPHTEVFPEFEGKGIGSALARHALEDVRAHGLAVDPQCPFIAAYVRKHPEFQDLLARRD